MGQHGMFTHQIYQEIQNLVETFMSIKLNPLGQGRIHWRHYATPKKRVPCATCFDLVHPTIFVVVDTDLFRLASALHDNLC